MPTHVAARMEQVATPGSIVITADTLAPLDSFLEVRPLGRVVVKGLAAGVEAYEMLGPGGNGPLGRPRASTRAPADIHPHGDLS